MDWSASCCFFTVREMVQTVWKVVAKEGKVRHLRIELDYSFFKAYTCSKHRAKHL